MFASFINGRVSVTGTRSNLALGSNCTFDKQVELSDCEKNYNTSYKTLAVLNSWERIRWEVSLETFANNLMYVANTKYPQKDTHM